MPPITGEDIFMFPENDDSKSSHRSNSRGRRSKSPNESDKGYNPNMQYGKDRFKERSRGYDSRYRRDDSRGYQREDKERYYSKRETKVYQKSIGKPSMNRARENSHSSYESYNESKRRKITSRQKRSPEATNGK